MFNIIDLVISDNMFNLTLTILLLYFIVKLQMCIYICNDSYFKWWLCHWKNAFSQV